MNGKSPRQMEDARRVAERAAEWLTVLPTATPRERQEFTDWVQASPEHLQEFLLASAIVRGLDGVDFDRIAGAASAPNIAHLPRKQTAPVRHIRASRRWAWGLAAGIAVIALATGASYFLSQPETFSTGVGEQRTLQLSDGSTVQMNVGSRLRIRLDENVRDIDLLSGEATFTVGKDPSRPFRVHTDTNVIQALGTEFNVRRRPSGTTVSVIEGLIQISDARFKAGEEARLDLNGRIEQRLPIDVVTVAAWRHNRLDFRSERLIDIAAEFNRYNRVPQIVIEDGALGDQRYSGVFDANNPRALADFLREDASLRIEERDRSIYVRPRE